MTSPAAGSSSARDLLVPLGSCEQHGPHLPLDTDTRIALEVASRAAGLLDAVVAPPIAYGASGEHEGFAGTLSIGSEALESVLVELARSAVPDPAAPPYRTVVFVNGHGGNRDAVVRAVARLRGEGRPVASWPSAVTDGAGAGDAHAGRTETSILLALAPELVGPERPVGETASLGELLPALRSGGVAAVSPSGVLGDATGASAAEGERMLERLVADLVDVVRSLG